MENERLIVFHLDDSKNLRGGERQVLYLANELSKLGVENYIVARKNSPLVEKAKRYAIPTIELPYFFELDIISAIILALKIRKINKDNRKVIIHTHTGHTPTIGLFLKFLTDAKVVVHRRVDFKLNSYFSRIKYNYANAIIVISNAIRNILETSEIDKSKIYLIPSSIPNDFIDMNIQPRKFPNTKIVVGSLISLVEHKDPLNLIRAAKIVIDRTNNVFFEIGGEGYLMKECVRKIREYKLEKNVIMKGYIENNKDFLKNIDIFVLPSKKEGLGSSLLEAMAFALPLIGTNAGGIPEIIENNVNGIVVPKENPQKLAEAILKLISDKNLYENLSKNSLIRVKNYSSLKMALSTLEVYNNVIKDIKSC